jgi:hypothetical protein
MEHIDADERDHLIDQAKLIAISTFDAEPLLQSPLITNDNYHQYFPKEKSSSSLQPSASLNAIAEEYNVKEPEETKKFKKLKRGVKEFPPKQTTIPLESSQPIQIHHKHNRLTEFEKNEFISLIHKMHLDIYNEIITYMAIASSIVDTEASTKSPRKRRHQDDEEYYEERNRKYGNRFASSDDIDYSRDKNYHNDRYYDDCYDDNNNNRRDNKKNKIKSRGTAISDGKNNNNPNLENNNNNNNNKEEEEEEDQQDTD